MTWDQEHRLLGTPPVEIGDIINKDGETVRVKGIEPFIYEFRNRDNLGAEIGFSNGVVPIAPLIPPTNLLYLVNFVGIRAAGAPSIAIRFNYPQDIPRFGISANPTVFDDTIADYLLPIKLPLLLCDTNRLSVVVQAPAPNTLDAIYFYGYLIVYESAKGEPITRKIPHLAPSDGRGKAQQR